MTFQEKWEAWMAREGFVDFTGLIEDALEAVPVAPNNPAVCAANCFEAGAVGDLDGDNVPALFALTGHVNVVTKKLKLSSSIYVEQQDE